MLAFIFASQEPKPNSVTDDEDMHKTPIEKRPAGTKDDSEQKAEDLFVYQHSSKPHVVRSFFFVSF